MLRLFMIDDEPESLQVIASLVDLCATDIHIAGQYTDPFEGLEAIQQQAPDILLLDIEMPGMTGLELLRRLPSIDFEVIFITAYNQYAVSAIKLSALDYLMKPVNPSELEAALEKAKVKIKEKKSYEKLEVLVELLQSNEGEQNRQDHRIVLPTFETLEFVKMCDIIRIEAAQNYCSFHLEGRSPLVISKNIGHYDNLLDSYGFMRIHRTHMINLHYALRYLKQDGGSLELTNGDLLPVSSAKREGLIERMKGL